MADKTRDEKPFRNKFAEDAFDTDILKILGKKIKEGEVPIEKVPLPRKKDKK